MGTPWIFYSALCFVVAAGEAFLISLLIPSPTYRTARRWLKVNHPGRYGHWLHYRTLKRNITPHSIAVNAANSPTFSVDDLEQLNALLQKLEQPPAQAFTASTGDVFDAAEMKAQLDLRGGRPTLRYVLEALSIGVKWKREVLKKVPIVACTADRLIVHRLAAAGGENPIVHEFISTLERNEAIAPDFELPAALLQGFIDLKMLDRQAEKLFTTLSTSHPERDFALVRPEVGEWYNADTMASWGGQLAGKKCKVAEVIYPGLVRQQNKSWRIKALVKIRNISRDEF